MAYKLIKTSGNARYGILTTAHSKVETPFFMPVATKTAVKFIGNDDLTELKTQAIICNGLILSLNPGTQTINKAGGLHKFMNSNLTLFNDSGGFQMIRDTFNTKSIENGLSLKDPFSGKTILLTPEKAMKNMNAIGADVIMALDDMPPYSKNKKAIQQSLERTNKWAVRCITAHKNKNQLLFGIAQGGVYKDLRKASAKFISNLNFNGFAFGGLAIGEKASTMFEMINSQISYFPENKPRYLLGLGHPAQMIEAISHGVDCFDSTFPTKTARHGGLFTKRGILKLNNAKYKNDKKPLDPDCNCKICKTYTRQYLRYLLKLKDPIVFRYLTYHNLYFIHNMLKETRSAIKNNTFEKYKDSFLKNWK